MDEAGVIDSCVVVVVVVVFFVCLCFVLFFTKLCEAKHVHKRETATRKAI